MAEYKLPQKEVYSTGELAKCCHVTKHTIITAIDRKELRASKTPGGHHRILRQDALNFISKHSGATPAFADDALLLIDQQEFLEGILSEVLRNSQISVYRCDNLYEAGIASERYRPRIVLIDGDDFEEGPELISKSLNASSGARDCEVVVLSNGGNNNDRKEGALYLDKPFTVEEIKDTIYQSLGLEDRKAI